MELDRTVITSIDFVVDQGVSDPFVGFLVDNEVVESPANVLSSSSGSHAPP